MIYGLKNVDKVILFVNWYFYVVLVGLNIFLCGVVIGLLRWYLY